MPDIVLINPPPAILSISDYRFQNVPLSLVYVGGYARKHGLSVRILDAYNELWHPSKVIAETARLAPRIVGVTCDATRVASVRLILTLLREKLPQALIVLGGPFPSIRQQEFFPLADVIVRGEGEASFIESAKRFLEGGPLDGIKGIFLRKENGYLYGGDREPSLPLDDYFFPAWDLVDLRHNFYFWGKKTPVATLVASRGCPEDCSYCTLPPLWGHRHRKLSVGRLVEELELLKEKYGIREVYFKDNLFTCDRKWVMDFCAALLRRGVALSWSCGTGVKYVDQEMLELMKKAGCHTIAYGFESGNDKVLAAMGKGVTVVQNLRAAEMTRRAGIRIFGFFMLGFPGETREQILDTIELGRKISPDMLMYTMTTPFHGTKLRSYLGLENSGENGTDLKNYNWYTPGRSVSQVSRQELYELKRKAFSAVRDWRYWLRYASGFSPEILARQIWRLFWIARMCLSPRYRWIRKDINEVIF